MRVYIPDIGEVLTLAEDWTFTVINERRNAGLAKLMNWTQGTPDDYYLPFGSRPNPDMAAERSGWYGNRRIPVEPGPFTIKAGTSLEVDRVYIRQGAKDFSSVSFKMHVKSKVVRFFAKLDDVNRIEL